MRRIKRFIPVVFLAAVVSCGHKNYDDMKQFIDEVVNTQNEFLTSMDKSSKADDAVSAINIFGDKLVRLSQKSVEIKKRHPEIDSWGTTPPQVLKKDLAKLDDPESNFEKVFLNQKIKPILEDAKVKEAFLNLREKIRNVKFF